MADSIDKGLPLLKPIRFADDDPNNPKYNLSKQKTKTNTCKIKTKKKIKIIK